MSDKNLKSKKHDNESKQREPLKITSDNMHLRVEGETNKINLENLHCGLDEKTKDINALIPIHQEIKKPGFVHNENNYRLEFKRRQDLNQAFKYGPEQNEISQTLMLTGKKKSPFLNIEGEGEAFIVNISVGENDETLKKRNIKDINLSNSRYFNELNSSNKLNQSLKGNIINPRADWLSPSNNRINNDDILSDSSKNLPMHIEKIEKLKRKFQEENVYLGKNKGNVNLDLYNHDIHNNETNKNLKYNYEKDYDKANNYPNTDEKNLNKDKREKSLSKKDMKDYENVENPFTKNAQYNEKTENTSSQLKNFEVLNKRYNTANLFANKNYNSEIQKNSRNNPFNKYPGEIIKHNLYMENEKYFNGNSANNIEMIVSKNLSKSPEPPAGFNDTKENNMNSKKENINEFDNKGRINDIYTSVNLNNKSINFEKSSKLANESNSIRRSPNMHAGYYTSKRSFNNLNNNNNFINTNKLKGQGLDENNKNNYEEELKNQFNNQSLHNNITKTLTLDNKTQLSDNFHMDSNFNNEYNYSSIINNTSSYTPQMNKSSRQNLTMTQQEEGQGLKSIDYNRSDVNMNLNNTNSFDINNVENKKLNDKSKCQFPSYNSKLYNELGKSWN